MYQLIGWPLFILLSLGLAWYSRKSLFNPRHFWFYRFFAFESLMGVFFLTFRSWLNDPFAPHQVLSWVLVFLAVVVAAYSLALLKWQGLPSGHFEQTTRLVTKGIYQYIRHPLYTALILLGWGVFLKNPLQYTTPLIFTACGLLAATAIVEEQQNVKKFGDEYRRYMEKSKRFIPFVF
jgi:protein-S-isoprenylcysteine O-methyltransferase Ste14